MRSAGIRSRVRRLGSRVDAVGGPIRLATVTLSEVEGPLGGRFFMHVTQLLRWNIGAATVMLVLAAGAGGGTAQELYGSVVGTVQDGSGARIPGATIEIVNRATNLVLTSVSNETGAYTFTNVLSGVYDVKITLQGFKEFKQAQVPVTAG